jgi:putative ABC transport system ATP-binding protein
LGKEETPLSDEVIIIKDLIKSYQMGETRITAVDRISFSIEAGSFVILLGASGAGKSTVLNILGGMDMPTSGSVHVFGQELSRFNDRELTQYRRNSIGFVFQFYNLMPNLTVLENVELARQICKNPLDAKECLQLVGLGERQDNFPSQISGGEQQRVAIARALAKNPELLLCDEPTGALDYLTGKGILSLLHKIGKDSHKTVIVVTHNSALAPMADTVIRMKSGQIVDILNNPAPLPVEEIEW